MDLWLFLNEIRLTSCISAMWPWDKNCIVLFEEEKEIMIKINLLAQDILEIQEV